MEAMLANQLLSITLSFMSFFSSDSTRTAWTMDNSMSSLQPIQRVVGHNYLMTNAQIPAHPSSAKRVLAQIGARLSGIIALNSVINIPPSPFFLFNRLNRTAGRARSLGFPLICGLMFVVR